MLFTARKKRYKLLLLTLLIAGICPSLYARQWNAQTIDNFSRDARKQLNLFIRGDNASNLRSYLSNSDAATLKNNLLFEGDVERNFANLQNKENILDWIIKNTYGNTSLRYAALLKQSARPALQARAAVTFYGVVLKNDDDAAKYAFEHLDALALEDNAQLQEWRKKLHEKYGFKIRNANSDSEQEKPNVCVNFNKTVRPEPAQHWQSLLTITPQPSGKLSYRGDSLCFTGEWQTEYRITVDKRLQSAERLTLEPSTTAAEYVQTGQRDPMIRFAGAGKVLNAYSDGQLGLSTVNMDNVKVELWQIPANNLSAQRIQSLIDDPNDMYTWRFESTVRQNAEKRFSGTFNVGEYKTNEVITTNIDFKELMKGQAQRPGIYVVQARNADISSDDEQQTRFAFAFSNAGFSAYLTDEGLWAELRDLSSTAPVSGQKVTLYAKNNRILATVTTDDKGVAHFDKPLVTGEGSLEPSHLIAEDDNYFAFLKLDKPADLSDKGLSGKVVNSAPLRSWIWSDRGVYRPNDTAHVMWLLKTPQGKAFSNAPIWLKLHRPDGKVVHSQMVKADASGAYSFDYHFNNSARQGEWVIDLSLGKDGAFLASKTLPVAAITPQQIEASIKPLEKPLRAKQTQMLTVKADWLYGAPASELPAYIEQTISVRQNPEAWKNWQIGLHDEKRYRATAQSDEKNTDSQGKVQFSLSTEELAFTTRPLKVKVVAKVTEPSGQRVRANYDKMIEREKPYLAIKKDASQDAQVALINDRGELQNGMAKWKLYRVHYDYYWYRADGSWKYQHNENRQLVTSGEVLLSNDKPSVIKNLPLDDGAWVLSVRGEVPEVASSVLLEFGSYARPVAGSAPDRITTSSSKTRYREGESVSVHLQAPFDGQASIKFASAEQIIDNRLVTFKDGQATLTFTWKKAWDEGLWLLANAWNKDQKNAHNRRAVGLHWLGGDLKPYTLDVSMQAPKTALPNTALTIPLSIPAEQAGQPTWARVAIIDDGLYRLAKASFSNPLNAFWDKKQLNVEFFDVWGEIIRQVKGRQAALRSGAGGDESEDLSALKALPELDVQLVTYWSQPVRFDSAGKATVSMDLPQFNGRLRVMVATWSADKLGAVEDTVQVRAPLVTNLYSPPYLSPKDSSSLRLRLHNTTAKPMTLTTDFQVQNLQLSKGNKAPITLAPEQVAWVGRQFSVAPYAKGRANITVHIRGQQAGSADDKQNVTIKRFADIRLPTLPRKSQEMKILTRKRNSAESMLRSNVTRFAAVSEGKLVERHLFLSTRAPFDPKAVLAQLNVYPYGCVEQTTSKAWNNLLLPKLKHYNNLPKSWFNSTLQKQRLFEAHSKLANYQHSDGGFSLWSYGSEDLWLSAYVSEFLLDSQRAGRLGNEGVLTRALDYLRYAVMQGGGDSDDGIAYAHYVLAKAGKPVQGAAVRFAESLLEKKNNGLQLSIVHTTAALVQHGELQLAERLLSTAVGEPLNSNKLTDYSHYGAGLRNLAQMLTILYQLDEQLTQMAVKGTLKTATQKAMTKLWSRLRPTLASTSYYSTQDLHWLANLAAELPKGDKAAELLVNGKRIVVKGNKRMSFKDNGEITVENLSAGAVYVTLSEWVAPDTQQTQENRYRIQMRYENSKGEPVDITQLKHNQQVLAVATITTASLGNYSSDIIFVYPLPAGLSIVPMAEDFEDKADRPWFKSLARATFSENRDDRHLAAFSINNLTSGEDKTFTHVFMLRASRKGVWHAPEYSVENMYEPEYRAVYPAPVISVE